MNGKKIVYTIKNSNIKYTHALNIECKFIHNINKCEIYGILVNLIINENIITIHSILPASTCAIKKMLNDIECGDLFNDDYDETEVFIKEYIIKDSSLKDFIKSYLEAVKILNTFSKLTVEVV